MKDKSIDGPGYTPGPWSLVVRRDGTIVVLVRDENGSPKKHIAEMAWAAGENGEPDARLIASAPALVEALQEAREALEPFAVGDPHSLGEHHLINAERAYKRIDAVLSTALGEMNDE